MSRYSEIKWEQGACAGAPTNLFYLIEENKKIAQWIGVGILREICASCSIYEQCLTYALENEHHGVWAGMTSNERNTLKNEFSGKKSIEIIRELERYGIPSIKIKEAVHEYKNNE